MSNNKVFSKHGMSNNKAFSKDGGGSWRHTTRAAGGSLPVLAFDIETTGLDADACEVTCACAYDPARGVERSFLFALGDSPDEFMSLLDEAPLLCAFNGVRFDIPFLCKKWGVPDERAGRWVAKLLDPFEACKLGLGQTFSLNRLLEANGLQAKTGSGLDAVNMAREGRWGELAEYCMHDTKMTHAAATLEAGMLIPGQPGSEGNKGWKRGNAALKDKGWPGARDQAGEKKKFHRRW